jgi:hypothetical protein
MLGALAILAQVVGCEVALLSNFDDEEEPPNGVSFSNDPSVGDLVEGVGDTLSDAAERAAREKAERERLARGHVAVFHDQYATQIAQPVLLGVGLYQEFHAGIDGQDFSTSDTFGDAPRDLQLSSTLTSQLVVLPRSAEHLGTVPFSIVSRATGSASLELKASNAETGKLEFDACQVESCVLWVDFIFDTFEPFEPDAHVLMFSKSSAQLLASCFAGSSCTSERFVGESPLLGKLIFSYEADNGAVGNYITGRLPLSTWLRVQNGDYRLSFEAVDLEAVAELRVLRDPNELIEVGGSAAEVRVAAHTGSGEVIYGKREYAIAVTGAPLEIEVDIGNSSLLHLTGTRPGQSSVTVSLGNVATSFEVTTLE